MLTGVKTIIDKFNSLRAILEEWELQGVELSSVLNKIDSVIDTIKENEISIALIGSFSDGKTSAIAGLLGEVLSNMKIAADESSDELTVYRYHALGKDFRIIDTPGLFGSKEKEVDGEDIRLSDITIKFLSEAHITIYVCDAVNPLKDSHVHTIKYIMKDLKKLDTTIFVINKMDEAGYDLTDEIDFSKGKEIKVATLQGRLKEALNLSDAETKALNIVCIAADPKGKGIEKWLNNLPDYMRRSRINDFIDLLNGVITRCDLENLNANVEYGSIKDTLRMVDSALNKASEPIQNTLSLLKEDSDDLNVEMRLLHDNLKDAKKRMIDRLDDLRKDITHKLGGARLETIDTILRDDIGVQEDKVSMYVLEYKIEEILSECSECNNHSIFDRTVVLEQKMEEEGQFLAGCVKFGANYLKNIKINANQVKAVRDVCCKSYKFKPWGAVNLGTKATKALGRVGQVAAVAVEGWQWFTAWRDNKKFNELKSNLLNLINDIFAQIYEQFHSEEAYYKNFAPSYLELKKTLANRENEIETLNKKLEEFSNLKEKVRSWVNDAKYVDFEEIK
jgi:Predicted GTPases